jgi:alkanesulfonate monooxygenase SsuD/methylene tetrahydromethanopterin reductase-like flavin-dependent oxidoreductase (luciferase family)
LQKKLPLWQVVDSPSSIEFAAKNDLGCLMWLPTVKSLKSRFEIYQHARSEVEQRDVPLGEGICLVRDVFIADSMEEAKELAGQHIVDYMSWVCGGGRGVSIFADPGEEFPKTDNVLELLDYEFLHPRNLLVGTADYVIEKIHELKSELNLQHLAAWSTPPGMPHETSMKSIKLFNEKVMPHFSDSKIEIKKVS